MKRIKTFIFLVVCIGYTQSFASLGPKATVATNTGSTPSLTSQSDGHGLQATAATAHTITIRWTAPADNGNDSASGPASVYDVRSSTQVIDTSNFLFANQVPSNPPGIPNTAESLVVTGLNPGTNYYFALKAADARPNWSELSNVVMRSTQNEYLASLVSQTPTSTINLSRGATYQFTVIFKNGGNTTWYNSAVAHPADYAELRSCDNNGSLVNSFLNNPLVPSLGWLNAQAPCTMQEASVAPNGNATFTFTGKVDANAVLGTTNVYFRVNHATGGLLTGTMHFSVNVIGDEDFAGNLTLKPICGDWTGDGKTKVGVWASQQARFYLDEDNDGVTDHEINFGLPTDIPLAGDWNGDGIWTIGVYRPSTCTFFLDNNNDGGADVVIQFGIVGDVPIVGDWGHTGRTTIGVRRPSNGTFYLDYNNDAICDKAIAFGGPADIPLAGDWDGNGTTTIGLRRPSNSYFFLDNNNDGGADVVFIIGFADDVPISGDWDGNKSFGTGLYRSSNRYFFLDNNNDGVADRAFILRHGYGIAKMVVPPLDEFEPDVPKTFVLQQNYPNPFNPSTTIEYDLPTSGNVTLVVYNTLGQVVKTLVDENQQAGSHRVQFDGSGLATGVYFYRLQTADGVSEKKKMLLIK